MAEASQELMLTMKAFQKQQTKGNDGYALNFSAEAKAQGQEVLKLYHQQDSTLDLEESAFRHAFNSQLDTALLLVSSKAKGAMNPLAGSKGTPTQHAYFQVPTTLLKLCQGMQTRYEQLSEMVDNAKPEAILGQPWQQDHEKLAQLLEIGHRVAERQIDELVQRDAQNMDTKAQVVVSDEDEQEAVEVLGMRVAGQDKKIPAIPWDESLRHAEHGVRRFTRGLPEEAE